MGVGPSVEGFGATVFAFSFFAFFCVGGEGVGEGSCRRGRVLVSVIVYLL